MTGVTNQRKITATILALITEGVNKDTHFVHRVCQYTQMDTDILFHLLKHLEYKLLYSSNDTFLSLER